MDEGAFDKGEFRDGWKIVVAAAAGSGLGVSALLTYTAGLFVKGMESEIGLSRTMFGLGVFGATLSVALAGIYVGRMVDREGPRRIAVFGALFLAAGFVALATLTHVPIAYVGAMIFTGLFAAGCSPVPYARTVTLAFERRRGLALGLMQMGIGLSAAIVPPLLGWVIASHGWRSGYAALAGVALLGLIPALVGLPRRSPADKGLRSVGDPATIRKSPEFWLLLVGFATMAAAFAGMLPHFVPMLIDLGVGPLHAASLAGLIGVSVIVVRIIVGWLTDFVHAPWIAAFTCLLCAAGCLVLSIYGAVAAPIGAIALGAAMGAEADLVGFLVARYFPLQHYGRIYSLQYAAFMTAAGFGPLWVGLAADQTGGYRVVLMICAGMLVIATVPFMLLPQYSASRNAPT